MISSTSERTRRCRTSFTISGVAVSAGPSLAGSLLELDHRPILRRGTAPRPRRHPYPMRPAAGTEAAAKRGQRALFWQAQRSIYDLINAHSLEANAGAFGSSTEQFLCSGARH